MKNYFLIFCSLFLLFFHNTSTIIAQEIGDPYVVLSEIDIDESNFDVVVDLLSELQKNTLEKEEGCIVFDVLLVENDFTKIFIYESYDDLLAFSSHTNSAYYKRIVNKDLKAYIKQETKTKVFPINNEVEMN